MIIDFQQVCFPFYHRIAQDSRQSLIHLVSEPGHGKTSSLRTIIGYIKQRNPDIVFKIMDSSQAWFHNAPTEWRQLVTVEKLQRGIIQNLQDCVYEIGSLPKDVKRAFVGQILKQDWDRRYIAKLDGTLDTLPTMLYVFEEADLFFGSYSFRRNDEASSVFQNYASVGRNYKMRGFLISTANVGEISPSLRRRTRKIYGRVISKSDLDEAKRSGVTEDLTKIPRYHFHYEGISERIPDNVQHTPTDYIPHIDEIEKPSQFDSAWLLQFLGTIGVFLLFWAWLMAY